MKMNKALSAFLNKAAETDSYWVEKTKLRFAMSLEIRRKAAGLSYKAVAEKLGTSAAYITKVFRGDANVTIESMVKLARATGGQLDIRVVEPSVSAAEWRSAAIQSRGVTTTSSSHTSYAGGDAANHAQFAFAA